MLSSDLFDSCNVFIIVKGRINIESTAANNQANKKLTLKNNVQFRSCTSKINNTFSDSVEDRDIVMPICNLLEHSDNYSKTSGSLWNHYREEVNYDANGNNHAGTCRIINR